MKGVLEVLNQWTGGMMAALLLGGVVAHVNLQIEVAKMGVRMNQLEGAESKCEERQLLEFMRELTGRQT